MNSAIRRVSMSFLGVLCFTWLVLPANAQVNYIAGLSSVQIEQFPQISAFLDIHDEQGDFVFGLRPEALQVLENGQPRPVESLEEQMPGVQFVIAFSLGPALGVRDAEGKSRLDYLTTSIRTWGNDFIQTGRDDISLVTQDGPEVIHVSDPGVLNTALRDYQPEARRSTPLLTVLSRAMQIAADDTPRPSMERAILFITPLQPAQAYAGLEDLTAQANQLGTHIFVWLVASPEDAALPGAVPLQNLALGTQGRYMVFSGTEVLPNLDEYLEPLRHIYRLTYTSALSASGDFPLSVEITQGDQVITSSAHNISLKIQPPNPIFIEPPTEITRLVEKQANQKTETTLQDEVTRYQPETQAMHILVEFPDGYKRAVVRTTFLVDGQVVQEVEKPPFDVFTWDLSNFLESGTHNLQVEVTDSQGLVGRSAEIPVKVTVQQSSKIIQTAWLGRYLLLAGVVIFAAGSIVGFILILTGRIQPVLPGRASWTSRAARNRSSQVRATRPRPPEPITQPLSAKNEIPARRFPHWTIHLPRAHHSQQPQPIASLTLITPGEEAIHEAPVLITVNEIIFGSDAGRATWAINDPTLEPVHAYLEREGEAFRILDEHTPAGTWVNYSPVPETGTLLEHGDLIHVGRVSFRFRFLSTERIRKPVILAQERSNDTF